MDLGYAADLGALEANNGALSVTKLVGWCGVGHANLVDGAKRLGACFLGGCMKNDCTILYLKFQ